MEYAPRILEYVKAHRAEIKADLLRLVALQSPSDSKAAADRCADGLALLVKERLGVEAKRLPQQLTGDHLLVEFGQGERRALVVGHFDTVWNIDALPVVVEEEIIRGPGANDMKFGDVSMIWALKAIKELDLPLSGSVALFFNADEEIGSITSSPLMLKEAQGVRAAIICEPSQDGALKIARKGGGDYDVRITGRASHAGSDHAGGRSAIEEAARQILDIHALTDYEKGTTTNVGVVKGGTKRNVVAAECLLEVDYRVANLAEAERIHAAMHALAPHREGVTVEITGSSYRPPFEDTPANCALFELARECGEALGLEPLRGIAVGGMSDGNFLSAAGVPTLDGMGAVGAGSHSRDEHLRLTPSLERTALLATVLTRL